MYSGVTVAEADSQTYEGQKIEFLSLESFSLLDFV